MRPCSVLEDQSSRVASRCLPVAASTQPVRVGLAHEQVVAELERRIDHVNKAKAPLIRISTGPRWCAFRRRRGWVYGPKEIHR